MKGSIHLVGDIMIDALKASIAAAEKNSNILEQLNLKEKEFMVATVHRAGNTDDEENLKNIVEAFVECGDKIVFPVHPRTTKALKSYGLDRKFEATNVIVVKPFGYIDMLVLEKNSKKILTDSGGVQKEAYFFKVPCITLRDETEWVETVDDGWNILTGSNKSKILDAIGDFLPQRKQHENYGNGNSASKIVEILKTTF